MALKDTLKMIREEKDQAHVRAHNRKIQWLNRLNELIRTIDVWILPLKSESLVERDERDITIDEELLGAYSAPSLILDFQGTRVEFVPVGTYIMGCAGRVDVVTTNSRLNPAMVLLPSITATQWQFAKDARAPAVVFDQICFENFVEEAIERAGRVSISA